MLSLAHCVTVRGRCFLVAFGVLGAACGSSDDDLGGSPNATDAPAGSGGGADAGREATPDAAREANPDALQTGTCADQQRDGDETAVDCGGPTCQPCGDGLECIVDADCKSARCGADKRCATPSCSDVVKNGGESDIDCGGPCTAKCDFGRTCNGNDDCQGGICAQGRCVECVAPTTCPGTDTECQARTCIANRCGTTNARESTQLAAQLAGDCKVAICDGSGGIISANDDGDRPVDGKECTEDACSNGSPSNPPEAAGTPCTENGGGVCADNGACVACNEPTDCSGEDTECRTRTCDAHVCGLSNAPATKVISAQLPGDCHTIHCDGSGGLAPAVIDDADLPIDGRECTNDLCTGGVASNPVVAQGAPCIGGTCKGIICGQCDVPADCPGTDGECYHRTCLAHLCGVFNDPPAMAAPTQVPGDCHTIRCDGSGGVTAAQVDDSDLPVDGNDCTDDICTTGTPSNPARAPGSVCAQAQGGRCDAGHACVPTFMVVRVGNGSAALTTASFAAFVERRYFDSTAALLDTIALPIAEAGQSHALTLSGTTTRDGLLSLSINGRYATLLGYGAPPGAANVATSDASLVNRIVARIDSNDGVDTSTALPAAFSGNNARSATSVDGTAFWVAGASTASGGIHYVGFGTTGGTRVLALPTSVRATFVFGGRLYGSSGDIPYSGIFTVGTGLPTAGGQTATMLPGMPTSSQSPVSFVLLDRDGAVAGPDTLYVADDRAPGTGGGIQKWKFDGTTWSLATTFNHGNTGAVLTVGMRGLAGMVSGNATILLATSADATQNRIFMYKDDGSSSNPTPVLLGTAAVNTVYRGIAFAP